MLTSPLKWQHHSHGLDFGHIQTDMIIKRDKNMMLVVKQHAWFEGQVRDECSEVVISLLSSLRRAHLTNVSIYVYATINVASVWDKGMPEEAANVYYLFIHHHLYISSQFIRK